MLRGVKNPLKPLHPLAPDELFPCCTFLSFSSYLLRVEQKSISHTEEAKSFFFLFFPSRWGCQSHRAREGERTRRSIITRLPADWCATVARSGEYPLSHRGPPPLVVVCSSLGRNMCHIELTTQHLRRHFPPLVYHVTRWNVNLMEK